MTGFSSTDFVPIRLDALKSGMTIDFSIYREKNGEYSLLGKDIVLTDELIDKFKRLTYPSYDVYVPITKYKLLTEKRNPNQPAIKKHPFVESYEQVKQGTYKMFEGIAESDTLPHEVVNEVAEEIHRQASTADVSQIIQSISMVRKVDEYLHTHSVNVALLNGVIGRWLKFDGQSLAALVRTGLLHDIGKLKIPQKIMNKPSKLSEDEFDVMMNHPIYSHEILVRSGYADERILKGVIQHHERVNGMGYPFGLNITNLTEFAKITSIADVYDAMVTRRAYKEPHSPFEILSWLAGGCYSELDFNYVTVFIECMTEELKGKKVRLSDGRAAVVAFVHGMNVEFPIVNISGVLVSTSEKLKCVALIE